ncbi:hypothetical protein [Salipaludibacillus sp. CF4.18]|uniref:hypothetical protein n=1 Tax=Salipaludibacillus sp. CF4.18 TaxID=3373081 RepID=UPI003EE438DC
MMNFLIVMTGIFLAGLSIGTMPALNARLSFPFIYIFLLTITILPLIIGIIIGAAFFYWLPIFFMKISLFLFVLLVIVYFFKAYHPSFGYFPYQGHQHWIIISLFYLLLGIEFAAYGFSAWFLLLVIPWAAGGMFAGFILMNKLLIHFRFLKLIHFVPIFLFIVLAFLKLV